MIPIGKRKQGFTLIELLVVIAIIAILAAILLPVFARARENARKSTCQNNLKQIGTAIMQYNQDYDERMPQSRFTSTGSSNGWASWRVVIEPYIKSADAFRCPSNTNNMNNANGNLNNAGGTLFKQSYVVSGGAGDGNFGGPRPMGDGTGEGAMLASIQSPSNVILVGEHPGRADAEYWDNNNDMRMTGHLGMTNFVFCDGHVKSYKPVQTAQPVNFWNNNNATAPAALIGYLQNAESLIK